MGKHEASPPGENWSNLIEESGLYTMPLPNVLPFRPWWHHPSARREGRHRGRYEFGPNPGSVIPCGVRLMSISVYGEVGTSAKAYRINEQGHAVPQKLPTSQTIGFGFSPEVSVF